MAPACFATCKKRKEQVMPFGVNSMRSQVLIELPRFATSNTIVHVSSIFANESQCEGLQHTRKQKRAQHTRGKPEVQLPLFAGNNQHTVKRCCATCVKSAADLKQGMLEQRYSLCLGSCQVSGHLHGTSTYHCYKCQLIVLLASVQPSFLCKNIS